MREVLQHSLGPNWRGLHKKIRESCIGIEKLAVTLDCILRSRACIIDALAIIQKHTGNQTTFAELASEHGGTDAVFGV